MKEPSIVRKAREHAAQIRSYPPSTRTMVALVGYTYGEAEELVSAFDALQQPPVAQDDPVAAVDNRRIANYIVEFLRARNGCELEEAIVDLTVESYELLIDELEDIIKWRGRPPNWSVP